MTKVIPFIGGLGAVLGIGGVVAYSLVPDKLWLVTLCEGLALVCLIGFFVLHFETVKAFSARRSTRLGLNSILMILLFLGIVMIVNFLAARHSQRWDFSETQRFTLAPQTYEVLRSLTRDVNITVFTQSGSPSVTSYRDLLDTYRQVSNRLQVEFVDPDERPAIARQYGITRRNTAVIESGSHSTRVTSPSEVDITGALIRVSRETKKQVVFLEGHGERAVNNEDPDGYSLAKAALIKQGYDVRSLTLLQETEVPVDTSVLVVAGPTHPVTKAEKERIASYVANGGSVLMLVDPDTNNNLDDLLWQWGVEVGKGVLVDLQDRLPQGDLTALMLGSFTQTEALKDFNLPVLFPFSRHLVSHKKAGEDWHFTPLARTSARSWAESDLSSVRSRVVSFNENEDVPGPLPLAVTLTPKETSDDATPPGAIVVVGNSSFGSNAIVNFPGNTDFFLHTIGWLAEEDALISITPKERGFRPFIPNPIQDRLLLYVQTFSLPALTFLWGFTVWRKRRRL